MHILIFLSCFLTSVLLTPVVKKFALIVGATDQPNHRKVHQQLMPRLGGLAIYISFILGVFVYKPLNPYSTAIFVGSLFIVITGIFDDLF
jgi:UDP-GlcNAc:undecaprenyl-phosphate GlcNAc-1-phosphate transferase